MERSLNPAAGYPPIGLKRIVLPKEHGSWSFLLEPLIVGIVVAFSPAAPWIALMVVASFFARQPLNVYWKTRNAPNLGLRPLMIAIAFLSVAGLAVLAVVLTAGFGALAPLLVAIPLSIQQLYIDATSRGRSLWAELSGGVAISCSVAMLAAAGGLTWPVAVGLWLIFVFRFVPSTLYVRNRLLLEKGKKHDKTLSTVAHVIGVGVVGYLASIGIAPMITIGVFVFLLGRSVIGLSRYRSSISAMKIGIWEVIYGLILVISTIVGRKAGI